MWILRQYIKSLSLNICKYKYLWFNIAKIKTEYANKKLLLLRAVGVVASSLWVAAQIDSFMFIFLIFVVIALTTLVLHLLLLFSTSMLFTVIIFNALNFFSTHWMLTQYDQQANQYGCQCAHAQLQRLPLLHQFAILAPKAIRTDATVTQTWVQIDASGTIQTWQVQAFVAIHAAFGVWRHDASFTATTRRCCALQCRRFCCCFFVLWNGCFIKLFTCSVWIFYLFFCLRWWRWWQLWWWWWKRYTYIRFIYNYVILGESYMQRLILIIRILEFCKKLMWKSWILWIFAYKRYVCV